MIPSGPQQDRARKLLAAAEEQLAKAAQTAPDTRPVAELLHGFQVHQVELEMQNENLHQTQELLEASRDRYAALYEFAPVGYLTLNSHGLITEINLTGASLLGVERKQLQQYRFTSLVAAPDQNRWRQHFLALKEHGGKQRITLALRRSDGSVFAARLDCELQTVMRSGIPGDGAGDTAIRPAAGASEKNATDELRMVLSDITDEALSKRQDETFRAIFDCSPVGIGIAGADQRYRMVNAAFCRMLGYSEAELLGKTYIDITHPDDVKLNIWNIAGLTLGEASHFSMEKRYIRKDGGIVWALLNVVTGNAVRGQGPYTIGLMEDITARKAAEAELLSTKIRFEATLGAIPDLLFEVDMDGRLYDYRAHRSDLLAAPPEAFLGKSFVEVLPPEATKACMGALREAAEKGWSTGATYCLPLPQGETWFELSIAAMPIKSDGDRRFILLARDITERKQAEEQRIDYARLQRDTLVREVHHRIKNNLQSVAGLLQRELGKSAELNPRLAVALSQINAIAVVHGLQSTHPDEAVRLCESVGSICKTVSELSQRRVRFDIEHEYTAFRPVRVDNSEAVPIALILNELILNAVKHSPPHSTPTVSLSANSASAWLVIRNTARNRASFNIDTGAGLGIGLCLVRSLLPDRGVQLSYEPAAGNLLLTHLRLSAPVVMKQDSRP